MDASFQSQGDKVLPAPPPSHEDGHNSAPHISPQLHPTDSLFRGVVDQLARKFPHFYNESLSQSASLHSEQQASIRSCKHNTSKDEEVIESDDGGEEWTSGSTSIDDDEDSLTSDRSSTGEAHFFQRVHRIFFQRVDSRSNITLKLQWETMLGPKCYEPLHRGTIQGRFLVLRVSIRVRAKLENTGTI